MTPLEEIEDLLARVAMADRRAFGKLYDRTSAKLFGVCLRVLNDREEAEEVLQEVFVTVWNKADSYRVNGLSPMTWLITITRNRAVDRRRARKLPPAPIETADLVPDRRPGPEAAAMARSEQARILACLGELPRARAHLVRRAYLDGDSYADLAQATGVKLNTVRTWLRRSLISLRECLSR
ncbi:sigma-70 family RNA polymerase sigma factor [Marivita sp. GX14005]|uniref:sigma-70 family RNA polymerase sigma factor n=1 Tax=Marivita sp. GX14005 TaxID=2942276 RepID=UPI002018C300|nr:sigma-70 family RNA polymerase sigma factor [Marivita sp. GX14005]MCL3883025.1 sigma-70 family RNA polymerase sigma factor [Marivita sp. GX14005]